MRERPLKYSRNSREAVLRYVQEFVSEHFFSPSIRQIGNAVGLSSSSTVHSHLQALEAAGHLRRTPSKPRSIELSTAPNSLLALQARIAELEAQLASLQARLDLAEGVAA